MTHLKQEILQSPCKTATVALTGLIFMTSAGVSAQSALTAPVLKQSSNPVAVQPIVATTLPIKLAVRRNLSQRLNIPPQSIKIVRFMPQTWSDGCLGLGGAAESCLQAQVEGWRVEVSANQQIWIYRTDQAARVIRLEPQSIGEVLPAIVSQRLIRTVAREVQVPAPRLQIAKVKSAVWGGCLGIFTPGRGCTRNIVEGWQVIVVGNSRNWVYHLDRDGSRIVQNSTASGSRGGLVPAFISEENKPQLEPNVIFRSTLSGDLSGKVTQTTLTTDGAITRFMTAPTIRSRPVVIKRLSQQQVEQFQQLLQAQRFSNLNSLSYLSDAVLADYPTTTVQGMGGITQYVDLEKNRLPPALRQVVQTWQKL